MRAQHGFTLIEMMVTLAVAIILLGAVTMGYFSTIGRATRDAVLSELSFTLSLARSEAIKRSGTVSVCPSNDATTCSGAWTDGWLMFANTDADAPPVIDTGEAVLRSFETDRSGYSLVADASVQSGISFRGRGTPTAIGSITLCSDDLTETTILTLSPIGVSDIAKGASCP